MNHPDQVDFIPNDNINREKWDRCIDQAVNGNICNYSWFLDIMCPGWDALVMGDYDFIMPLPLKNKLGIRYLFQPLFIQQCGVFGRTTPSEEILNQFLKAIPQNISVIDYHFNEKNDLSFAKDVEKRPNLLLNLNKSYEELKLNYTLNLSRNLRKSVHTGFHIIHTEDPSSIIDLFRKEKGGKFSAIKDQNYLKLTRVINACLHRNKAKVWSVYNRHNELIAGVIWLFSHGRAVFYFSAQSKSGKQDHALTWLIDDFIHKNASSGIILDFEGSINPGLARFYAGFGSLQTSYPRLKLNNVNPLMNTIYQAYRKINKR